MSDITKSAILNVLKNADDSDFNKNLLTLNSIKTVEVNKDSLKVEVALALAPGVKNEMLKEKLTAAFKKEFTDLKQIEIVIQAKASAQTEIKKDGLLPGVKNTIAVASGKGGVGKSTIAVNLAVALAREGANVGLIDADIYGPSIPTMLGVKDKPKVYQSDNSVRMIPIESYGIKMISIGLLVDENAPVIWRGPMASGAIKQFMSDVEWGVLDYLIFDMPPGTGDIQLTLVQTIPLTGAIIVTTPQEVSLIDARKALKMFTRVNVPIVGVIENMSYFVAPDTGKKYDIFGTGGGNQLAEELDAPFLGGMPIEPKIRVGGDNGIPILFDDPDSQSAKNILEISRKLAGQIELRNRTSGSKIEIVLDDDE